MEKNAYHHLVSSDKIRAKDFHSINSFIDYNYQGGQLFIGAVW